jgi:anti-sigma B factor antagonist
VHAVSTSLEDVRDGDERLTVDIQDGDPPTVTLTGEVDPHTAPQLEEALTGLIDGGASAVRIDASGLEFIDSSGLRVLVDAHRRLGAESSVLVLAEVSPTFRRLLEVTGLDEHVTIESTSE